jgi:hypothetical protein
LSVVARTELATLALPVAAPLPQPVEAPLSGRMRSTSADFARLFCSVTAIAVVDAEL